MNHRRFDAVSRAFAHHRLSRRQALTWAGAGLASSAFVGPSHHRVAAQGSATPAAGQGGDLAGDIVSLARAAMTDYDLRAVILRVTVAGEEVVTTALGESLTGVPATPEMRFRNGAVAFTYLATMLLQLVDQGVVSLDDPLATWLPDLPEADRVTLKMLANMTSGYADHVQDEGFLTAVNTDPFRQWTPEELIAFSIGKPHVFEPGTNWDYSHTGYVILGRALEAATDTPMDTLMREMILDPLGLANTTGSATPAIPEPVLHTFSSERRATLGIDPDTYFYEEATFWNPSWTVAAGAVQTTTIADMTASAEAIGTGALLSPESHRMQVGPDLLGFGTPLEGCPTCHTLVESWNYGLGIVRMGPWLVQTPLFSGCGALMAYIPAERIAVGIAVTFGDAAFDATTGDYLYGFASQEILAGIATVLAPDHAPPHQS